MKDYIVQQLDQTNIIGYKLTDKNHECRGFEYKIGETYSLYGKLIFCKNGFHFCEDFADCYKYYDNIDGDCHLLKVKAIGTVLTDGNKLCTDKIEILEEITDIEGLIEENQDKVDWERISRNQRLSEDFIERNSDKLDWNAISTYQKLSEDFMERHNYIRVYVTRDAEAGNEIDEFCTLEDAKAAIERYEEEDKRDGNYTEGFYEIVEQTKKLM